MNKYDKHKGFQGGKTFILHCWQIMDTHKSGDTDA